ncbi:hypothetical protein BofuT4_P157890.1 [Botrytis cinerea T4]|uniref:Uncharacterized protein n=1 Tax=Botryotinia fuckeliana (strain T4) TaxID=999810 RepID=G2YUU5_BOTF4|nr:hypothetical protein BofuT4_P157890.1 [Botrytis cinerea T4]
MRTFFSRSPDLEGGQNRSYKKGFTGDHRGRSHIPPNPSPLFTPQSQHSPFSLPSTSYRHDTIFRAPPSPSPKSVTFSEPSWSAVPGPGNVSGHGPAAASASARVGEKGYWDLDDEQISRLREVLGGVPERASPRMQRARRAFSWSDPDERAFCTSPVPLSPHSRLKKNLKQKVAEQQFRRRNQSQDGLLGDAERVEYQTRVFREVLGMALGRRGEEEMGGREMDADGDGDAEGEGKRPVVQRRGASEGVREGGFTGMVERERESAREEDVGPRDLSEFLEKYDPRPEDLPDVYPMGEHRAMLRTMYMEDILHSTAKLHMHNWILMSRNEEYDNLRIPARWDQIQEDLEKYTRSIRNYEYWLTSLIPRLELPKTSLPPRFHLYGKQLAILECARAWNRPCEEPLVAELERKLVAYQTDWSAEAASWRPSAFSSSGQAAYPKPAA